MKYFFAEKQEEWGEKNHLEAEGTQGRASGGE